MVFVQRQRVSPNMAGFVRRMRTDGQKLYVFISSNASRNAAICIFCTAGLLTLSDPAHTKPTFSLAWSGRSLLGDQTLRFNYGISVTTLMFAMLQARFLRYANEGGQLNATISVPVRVFEVCNCSQRSVLRSVKRRVSRRSIAPRHAKGHPVIKLVTTRKSAVRCTGARSIRLSNRCSIRFAPCRECCQLRLTVVNPPHSRYRFGRYVGSNDRRNSRMAAGEP